MAVVLLCLWLYEDDGGGSTHALIKKMYDIYWDSFYCNVVTARLKFFNEKFKMYVLK